MATQAPIAVPASPATVLHLLALSLHKTHGRQAVLSNLGLNSFPIELCDAFANASLLPPVTDAAAGAISLAALQVIDLQHNQIVHVSERINELTSIVELNLANNHIKTLPPLSSSSASNSSLSSSSTTSLPSSSSSASSSSSSSSHDGSNNRNNSNNLDGDSALSPSLSRAAAGPPTRHIQNVCLSNLTTLCLSDNDLSDFPLAICGLGSTLKRLFLAHNDITSIPPQISHFRVLEQLDLASNRIQELPDQFWSVTSLMWLQLDNNLLASLSPKLGYLRNLEYLSLNNNLLQSLPEEIGQLHNLRRFTLAANAKLTHLPLSLLRILKNLEQIRIDGPGVLPQAIIDFGGSSIIAYFGLLQKLRVPTNPTAHWIPDEKEYSCFSCDQAFSFTKRRHHCRLCGRLFCNNCCDNYLEVTVLDPLFAVRVCNKCYQDVRDTLRRRATAAANPASRYVPQKPPPSGLPQHYGLTAEEDQALDFISKKSKLEDQLEHIRRARKKEVNGKKGLEKLLKFYTGDTPAQQRTLEELAAIDERIAYLNHSKDLVRHQLMSLVAASADPVDLGAPPPPPDEDNETEHLPPGAIMVVGLYDYHAINDRELSFKAGDVLLITSRDDPEWWYAETDEHRGYVPYNYVEEM